MQRTSVTRNNPGAAVEKLDLPGRAQSHSNKRHGVAGVPPPAAEFRMTEVATT
jgi:hypothetical protein